jgi:hypothetical protein
MTISRVWIGKWIYSTFLITSHDYTSQTNVRHYVASASTDPVTSGDQIF